LYFVLDCLWIASYRDKKVVSAVRFRAPLHAASAWRCLLAKASLLSHAVAGMAKKLLNALLWAIK
jgi:hypothetical protein